MRCLGCMLQRTGQWETRYNRGIWRGIKSGRNHGSAWIVLPGFWKEHRNGQWGVEVARLEAVEWRSSEALRSVTVWEMLFVCGVVDEGVGMRSVRELMPVLSMSFIAIPLQCISCMSLDWSFSFFFWNALAQESSYSAIYAVCWGFSSCTVTCYFE